MVDLLRRLEAIQTRLDGLAPTDPVELDVYKTVQRQRTYLEAILGDLDPDLTPPDALNEAGMAFDAAEAALLEYQAVPGLDKLIAARDALFGAIKLAAFIPMVGRDPEITHRAARRYRVAAREATEDLEARLRQLAELTNAVYTKADETDAAIAATASDVETRVAASLEPLEARAAQIATTLTQQEERVSRVATSQVDQYTQAEERRLKEFADLIEKLRTDNAEFMKEEAEKAEAQRGDLAVKAKSAIDGVEARTTASVEHILELEQDARKLVNKTGETAISGGFYEDSEAERKRASLLQKIGAGLVVALAAFGFLVVVVLKEPVVSLDFLAGRLLVSLPILGLAVYFFREAGQHRKAQILSKAMYLDHHALGPYTELMDDAAAKEKLQIQLAERAFFRERDDAEKAPSGDIVHDLLTTMQELIKALGKRT